MTLANLFSKLFDKVFNDTYKKEDIINEEELIKDKINSIVILMLEELKESLDQKSVDSEITKELREILKQMKVQKYSDISAGLSELRSFFIVLEHAVDDLIKETMSVEDDVITDKTMTTKQAAIISTISNIQTLLNYTVDFCYFVVHLITDSKSNLPPAVELRVKDLANEFGRLYVTYNKKKIIKEIKSIHQLSDSLIYDETAFEATASSHDKKYHAVRNGLTINPIFYVRKVFVDARFLWLDYLKYKKTVFEYKIKEREFETNDPKIKKQVEYYQKKLEDVEDKIRDIEKDYE